MKTERELNLLEGKINVLRASIDDMPELKYVADPKVLSTVLVENGNEEVGKFNLGSFHEVIFVGNQAINVNITSVNTIVNVLLMSYLNQQGYKDVTAFRHGLVGNVVDFGALSKTDKVIV